MRATSHSKSSSFYRVVKKRLQKAHETKMYMEDFIQEQGRWKEIERSRRKEENDKIEAYTKLLLNRENEIKSLKKGQEEARNQIYTKVIAVICCWSR